MSEDFEKTVKDFGDILASWDKMSTTDVLADHGLFLENAGENASPFVSAFGPEWYDENDFPNVGPLVYIRL